MNLAGKLIGPHIIGGVVRNLGGDYIPDILKLWQPRLILILNPNAQDVKTARLMCNNAVIVQRIYEDDSVIGGRIAENPIAAARWSHDLIMQRGHLIDEMMFAQVENEVGEKVYADLWKLKDYAIESMKMADASGFKRCIFNCSVGWPDMPEGSRMEWWKQLYPAMRYARDNGHLVGLHQYGGSSIFSPNGGAWTSGRLENQVIPLLPDEFDSLKFAITEFGVSNIEGAPKGWRLSYSGNYGEYNADMQQHADWVASEGLDERIVGYAVFTWGRESAHWEPNDIEGPCAKHIATNGKMLPLNDFDAWMGGSVVAPPPPGGTVLYQAKVTNASALNLRVGPGTNHAVVGQLARDAIVDVLADAQIWWQVRAIDQLTGYAHSAYLEKLATAPPPTVDLEARVAELERQVSMLAEAMDTVSDTQGDTAFVLAGHEKRITALEDGGTTPPVEPPADPRATNARSYRTENGKVVGVNLSYIPIVGSKWRLIQASLIDENAAQGQTVARIIVRDKSGVDAQVLCYLGWPWQGWQPSGPMANRLLPGNANYPYQHVIINGYDASAKQGPLAIYIGDANGNPQSDVIGGLGLPHNRHVGFHLVFQER